MKSTAAEWTTFRMPFWRWFVAAAVFAQFIYLPGQVLAIVLLTGSRPLGTWQFWAATGFGAAAILAAMAVLALFVAVVFRYRVGPAGLRGYNGWGWPVAAPWVTMTRVQRYGIPAVPFIRVWSSDRWWTLWVPLFMVDYDRFAALVAEYAGDDHPVAVELLSRLEADA